MEITPEIVEKLAGLAKLSFDDKEKEKIASDLSRIVSFMEMLNHVDVNGVEPLVYLSDNQYIMHPEVSSGLRADFSESELSHERVLENAPKKDSDYFRVPKVLNKVNDKP
jgi:aspartyl-tRNA(Asn)/glutamyl-tRNA(Gln) amidotransferase subunit C